MPDQRSSGGDADLIIGRNPVREALQRDDVSIEKVYLQRGARGEALDAIRRLAQERRIQVQFVPPAKLRRLADEGVHQGVVALAAPIDYLDVDEMLRAIAPLVEDVARRKPIVVILDQIQDPHNYGAILRSVVAAGLDGVIVPSKNMAPLSSTAIKSSAGAALRVPIARASSLTQTIASLKERGYWVAGAASDAAESIWDADWDRALALVIGGEGPGLRPSIRAACDFLVSIPMRGPVDSLNASVAAGILFFAATRTRAPREGDPRA